MYTEILNNPIILNEMETYLSTHEGIRQAETSQGPDECSNNIQKALSNTLDLYLPLQKFQTNKKQPPFAYLETRNTITQRDKAYKQYRATKDIEDKRHFNHLKNLVTKQLDKDKIEKEKKDIEEAISSKDQWSKSKLKLGWTRSKGPSVIIEKGTSIQSPKEIARVMNHSYLQ